MFNITYNTINYLTLQVEFFFLANFNILLSFRIKFDSIKTIDSTNDSIMKQNIEKIFTIYLAIIFVSDPSGSILFSKQKKSEKISKLIYRTFVANDDYQVYFCARRFNSTNSFGCSSKRNGNIGKIYPIEIVNDLKTLVFVTDRREKILIGPKILLINVIDFESISFVKDQRYNLYERDVNGIILYMSDQINQTDFIEYQSYSHDSMCPNQNYGFRNLTKHCKTAWIVKSNPFYEFALIEWPFPIFLVRNYDIVEQIYYCHSRFKERCYVQLNSFMFGAINSKRCLSRNHNHQIDLSVGAFCQSIKAQNVFSPFSFIKANKELSPRSVLILTARLDSFTMFDSYSPGANSVYASVITLLAVAACVNQNRAEIIRLQRQNRRMHNVLYALFDAESFGHIGSDGWIFSNNFIVNQSYSILL